MTKYGLHNKLSAKPGNADQLAEILLKASKLVATAKGCHLYSVAKDDEYPNSIWITEIWDSKEDHDNSLKVEGVRALIGTAMPLLDGMPKKGQELKILGGFGI